MQVSDESQKLPKEDLNNLQLKWQTNQDRLRQVQTKKHGLHYNDVFFPKK